MTAVGTTSRTVAAAGAPRSALRRVGRGLGHAGNLAAAALAAVLVLLSATTIVATLTRHHFEQVITGSMVPTIPVGSMVVTEKVGVTSLGVGDVLVFPKPTNRSEVIVHRIVALTTAANGTVQVRTKGDANTGSDPWVIEQPRTGVADRAVYVVPGLGTALLWGRNGLVVLLPALLMVWLIASARRRVLAIVRSEA